MLHIFPSKINNILIAKCLPSQLKESGFCLQARPTVESKTLWIKSYSNFYVNRVCLFKRCCEQKKVVKKKRNEIEWILGMLQVVVKRSGEVFLPFLILTESFSPRNWKRENINFECDSAGWSVGSIWQKNPFSLMSSEQINLNFNRKQKMCVRLHSQLPLLSSCLACHKASSRFHLMNRHNAQCLILDFSRSANVIVCGLQSPLRFKFSPTAWMSKTFLFTTQTIL